MSSLAVRDSTGCASRLVGFVEQHPRLFVLTGAGCSTASGIPDYRDADGEWKHTRPVQYQDFMSSARVRQRYWARSMLGWQRVTQARPNSAHLALARLETAGVVHHMVTQNVDGLHQKAGSRRVIDLHGRLETVDCLDCLQRSARQQFQQALLNRNPEFARFNAAPAPDGDADLENADFGGFEIPACRRCGGVIKPSVVFFGESVPPARVHRAYAHLEECDAMMVVGSSLMVYSGYRFCRRALEQNKPIAAINLGRTRADDCLSLKVVGQCGEILTDLVERLDL